MVLTLTAAAGMLSGLLWTAPALGALDARMALAFNRWNLPHVLDWALAAARPLGTRWAWLAMLAVMVLAEWRRGLWLIPAAVVAAAAERGLKAIARRPRPFRTHSSIVMRQSPPPADTGFPSGDAMRVWFVACGLGCVLPEVSGWLLAPVVLASLLVSLGRVRSGAHYPLDVWTGGWIGIGFAAGAAALAA